MRRIPIPLILAAAIAVGITVTIIIQIVSVLPPGGVLLLLPQGETTKTYSYQILVGSSAKHFMPLGYGKFALRPNNTGWSYYVDTSMPGIVAVSKPFTGVIKVTVDGTDYYLCNNSNYGAVVRAKDNTGWVGDWVKVGGYYILNPRNVSDATGYADCARDVVMTSSNIVLLYEPNSEYFLYDASTTTIKVYFDAVDTSGVKPKYGYITLTPTWTPLPQNSDTEVGTYSPASDDAYIHYPSLIYVTYIGSAPTELKVTPIQ